MFAPSIRQEHGDSPYDAIMITKPTYCACPNIGQHSGAAHEGRGHLRSHEN